MGKDENRDNKGITAKKGNDLSEWYTQVVQKAELADYSPIQGFMIIRPNAYAIWQKIQDYFNDILKKKNIKNAYFPLLIPNSFFTREAEHAEGFAPELAYVKNTEAGELLAIRPTSETIMYDSFSKWIRSHRDLPLKINQWCNVVRWEVKQTKPFLRTREFLWQEGHCAFETEKEAIDNMEDIIEEYKKLCEELLAIPVVIGKKSEKEKFAGAKTTMTIEAMMPDGKALQCGTSHNLGQNFAKTFDVKFLGKDEKESFAWQTSWGFTTRLIGAMIMVHGDDKGFIVPPRVAENKCVIVPIFKEDSKEKVVKKAEEFKKELSKFSPLLDDREGYSPGWKYNEWEMKGIPLRIEIGPKDIENKQVVVVRRDTGKKEIVPEKKLSAFVKESLDNMQQEMFAKAKQMLDASFDQASSIEELKKKLDSGKIVKVYMKNDKTTEDAIKDKTAGATSRFVEESKAGKCILTGESTKTIAYFARSY